MIARNTKRARAIIKECMETDSTYYKFLHVDSGDLKKAVNHTFSLVKAGCTFYEVQNESGRSIGYFIINKVGNQHNLVEFFLNAHLRVEECKKDFWILVESKLNFNYFCQITAKNITALKFLEKKGLIETGKEMINGQTFYKYSKR